MLVTAAVAKWPLCGWLVGSSPLQANMKQLVRSSWNLIRNWGKTRKRTNGPRTLRICIGDILYVTNCLFLSWKTDFNTFGIQIKIMQKCHFYLSAIHRKGISMFTVICILFTWRDICCFCHICLNFYIAAYTIIFQIYTLWAEIKIICEVQ